MEVMGTTVTNDSLHYNAIGYNAANIEALRDTINTTCQKAGEGIVERLHNDIILPMSEAWYAPEAIDFFQGFADTVKLSGEAIKESFDIASAI